MAKSKEIKVLDDLLEATKDEPVKDYNFEKIMSLIEKSRHMKKEERSRLQRTNDYFKQLKDKLAENTAFLDKARKDLDNFTEVKDLPTSEFNTVDEYNALMKMSDEDIAKEITHLKAQLDMLNTRVSKFNERASNADKFYTKSMKTLDDIKHSLNTNQVENKF